MGGPGRDATEGGAGRGALSNETLNGFWLNGGGGGIDDVGVSIKGLVIGIDEADICLLGNGGRL